MFIFYLIQFTWGLPQNLVGLVLSAWYRYRCPECQRYRYHGAWIIEWSHPSSVSLGQFIFFGHGHSSLESVMRVHEYGHTIQSLVLGPFYLLLIGLPSLFWANVPMCVRYWRRPENSYFRFYTEKWANRWGEKSTGEKAPHWGDL